MRLIHTLQPGFGVGSTTDVAYFDLRTGLGGLKQHGCPMTVLGNTLLHRLTPGQQRELLSYVPRAMAAYFRMAIRASRH